MQWQRTKAGGYTHKHTICTINMHLLVRIEINHLVSVSISQSLLGTNPAVHVKGHIVRAGTHEHKHTQGYTQHMQLCSRCQRPPSVCQPPNMLRTPSQTPPKDTTDPHIIQTAHRLLNHTNRPHPANRPHPVYTQMHACMQISVCVA